MNGLTDLEFDTLDALQVLGDCATIAALAMQIGLTDKGCEARVYPMQKAGLLTRYDGPDGLAFRPSALGRARYERALVVMAGEPVRPVPAVDPLIDLPSLIAARILTLDHPVDGVESKKWGSAASTACPVEQHDWSVSLMDDCTESTPVPVKTSEVAA